MAVIVVGVGSGGEGGARVRARAVRQLRDTKISPLVELMDEDTLRIHSQICARTLARAHARSGDPAMLSGYKGSSHVLDEALAELAVAYADQAERDHRN